MPDRATVERIVDILAERTENGATEWETTDEKTTAWQTTKGRAKFTVNSNGDLTFEQEGERHSIGQKPEDNVRTFRELVGRIRKKEQEKKDRAYQDILDRALNCLCLEEQD